MQVLLQEVLSSLG